MTELSDLLNLSFRLQKFLRRFNTFVDDESMKIKNFVLFVYTVYFFLFYYIDDIAWPFFQVTVTNMSMTEDERRAFTRWNCNSSLSLFHDYISKEIIFIIFRKNQISFYWTCRKTRIFTVIYFLLYWSFLDSQYFNIINAKINKMIIGCHLQTFSFNYFLDWIVNLCIYSS
jgi:hypothetical protein